MQQQMIDLKVHGRAACYGGACMRRALACSVAEALSWMIWVNSRCSGHSLKRGASGSELGSGGGGPPSSRELRRLLLAGPYGSHHDVLGHGHAGP
jgi:hypothetical protein